VQSGRGPGDRQDHALNPQGIRDMQKEMDLKQLAPKVVDRLSSQWGCDLGGKGRRALNPTGQKAVHKVLIDLISILFPGCHSPNPAPASGRRNHFRKMLTDTSLQLQEQVQRAFAYQCEFDKCRRCDGCAKKAREAVSYLIRSLPGIQQVLQKDIVAAYEGDPAAKSTMEVVMSYPGLYAIIVHRLAHPLYEKKVPLIPRIMSEYAHSCTGIDIHPGATIGPGFFIDHGTGVVIGETCLIGKNVKLYQGVTLGALSFEKDAQGRLVKGIKRHPNVGDNVVIYAGATILGGLTTIGAHSEVGGNVWLIHSVPPRSKVYNQQPKPLIRQVNTRLPGPAVKGERSPSRT